MNMPGLTADNSIYNNGSKFCLSPAGSEQRSSAIAPQLRVGGGGLSNKCDDDYGECYIDCSVKYPESKDSPNNLNSDFRQACFDSCDAAHDLCGGGRLAIGRMNAVRIPFSSRLGRASFT
jgi:hypothetical protein